MNMEDVPVVAGLIAECYKFLAKQQKFTPLQLKRLLEECCSEEYVLKLYNEFPHYVAETKGGIVGIIGIEGNDIGELWVFPKYHHQGVGAELFKKAEQLIVEAGYSVLTVHTTGYAIPFYEAMGAHVVGKKLCSGGPLKGWPLTFLEKSLNLK